MVITGHVISAILKTFGMETLNDQPSEDILTSPEIVWTQPNHERKSLLERLSKMVVEKFINHFFNQSLSSSGDRIHDYTKYLMSIGCMYILFKDAIKEGDGRRVLQYYRYLLPVFINAGRRNYANESLNLLCQYHFDLPPRMAQQLIWSRFVNAAGIRGRNIPADQHLEHLNRILKGTVEGLGSNKTKEGIVRCSKALGVIHETLKRYDQENSVCLSSGAHGRPEYKKELQTIIKELQENKVLEVIPGRKHASFSKPVSLMHAKPTKDILAWVVEHLEKRYFNNKT